MQTRLEAASRRPGRLRSGCHRGGTCGSAWCSKPSWTGRWRRCWLAAGGRAGDHRHRGRGGRVRPAPALRRGGAARQRASARAGLAGRDRPARAAAGRAERLGQPAAPGRRTWPGSTTRTCGTRSGWPPMLGADRVVAMAGCPARRAPGIRCRTSGRAAGCPTWRASTSGSGSERIAPYWSGLAEFAAAEHPDLRVCLELHPGTCVFNVETFRRVAALGPVDRRQPGPEPLLLDGHGRAPGGRGAG